jgi:hypothetical protein
MDLSSPVDQLSVLRSADTFAPNPSGFNDAVFAQAQQFTSGRLGSQSETTIDSLGNRYTIGTFSGTVDFDPSLTGETNLVSVGNAGIFISKLDSSGNFVWAKSVGGATGYYDNSVAVDAGGNVYIAGPLQKTVDFDPSLTGIANLSSAGDNDIFISKLDTNGNFVWAKSIGGPGGDTPLDLAVDRSGNVYTCGYFYGTADFDPSLTGITNLVSAGENDIFVSKLDNNGNFVWAKSMGGTGNDVANGIAIDSSGACYISGLFRDTADFDPSLAGITNLVSDGYHDAFISKLDSNGNFVWAKSMGGGKGSSASASRVRIDSIGNVYTTGSFQGTVDFDPSPISTTNFTSAKFDNLPGTRTNDVFVSKLDSDGNLIWAKAMGGSDSEMVSGLAIDANGNVYTSGTFESAVADFDPSPIGMGNLNSKGYNDAFISKLDSSGNFVWAKAFGGDSFDNGAGLVADGNGNIYTSGFFTGTVDFDPSPTGTSNLSTRGVRTAGFSNSGIFLAKLTTAGDFVQAQQFTSGSLVTTSRAVIDNFGNRYISGFFNGIVDFDLSPTGTANLVGLGKTNRFISKLGSNGNFIWAKAINGVDDTITIDLEVDTNGNVYTTGTFRGTVDFDPSLTGTANLISEKNQNIYISKLDSNGEFVWAKAMGGAYPTGFEIDANGNIYTTGHFYGVADFDPSLTGTANLGSTEGEDNFISKLDSNGNFVWAKAGYVYSYSYEGRKLFEVDSRGNIYTTGSFSGTVDFDPSLTGVSNLSSAGTLVDIFVSKLDSNGNFVWAKSIGSTGYDRGQGIAIDADSNIYITGTFSETVDFDPSLSGVSNLVSAGNDDIFVSKLDSNGNFVWAKSMGSTSYEGGNSIAVDSRGSVYSTGYFAGTIDFDPGVGIASASTLGETDIFISKLDRNGNFVWAKAIGGTSSDSGISIAVDLSGTVYASGGFTDTVDFDPGVGTVNLQTGGRDIGNLFLLKLSQVTEARRSEIFWRNPNGTEVTWQLDNSKLVGAALINSPYNTPAWSLKGIADMDGDGIKDQIYQNVTTRQLGYLPLTQANGLTTGAKAAVTPTFNNFFGALAGQVATPGVGWELIGIENIAGTAQADLIFYSRSLDRLVYWETNTTGQFVGAGVFTSSLNPGGQGTGAANSWNVEAIADFTGDNQVDILWRNTAGVTVLWKVNGSVIDLAASKVLPTMTNNFELRGVGDFNGDRIQDIAWRDKTANITRFWTFNSTGNPTQTTDNNAIVAAGFQIEAIADFDGDGKSDLVWRDTVSDRSVIWNFDLSGALAGPTFQVGSIRPGSNFIRNFLPGVTNNLPYVNGDRTWDIDAANGI